MTSDFSYERCMKTGGDLVRRGDYANVHRSYEAALSVAKSGTQRIDALTALARVSLAVNDANQCMTYLDEAERIPSCPGNVILAMRAWALSIKGDLVASNNVLKQLTEHYASQGETGGASGACESWALNAIQAGDDNLAVSLFEISCQHSQRPIPVNVVAYAKALLRIGNNPGAIEKLHLGKSMLIDPTMKSACIELLAEITDG